MQQDTIRLVQDSWQKVAGMGPPAAALFYDNLFAADPALRKLFKGDMQEQGKKLLQMINLAVSKLDDLDTLVPALQNLAKRHVGYGVKDEHYDTVGAALLKTLGQGLGPDFNPPVQAAWTAVYGTMSDVMRAASKA